MTLSTDDHDDVDAVLAASRAITRQYQVVLVGSVTLQLVPVCHDEA